MTTNSNQLDLSSSLVGLNNFFDSQFYPKINDSKSDDKCTKLCVETLLKLAQLVEVKENKIVAKPIDTTKATKVILFDLVDKIKSDPKLKQMILDEMKESDESMDQLKVLLTESCEIGEEMDEGWVMIDKSETNQELNTTSYVFFLPKIAFNSVYFLFSGVWYTTKFSYKCLSRLISSYQLLREVFTVGMFVSGVASTVSNPYGKILQQLMNLFLKRITGK